MKHYYQARTENEQGKTKLTKKCKNFGDLQNEVIKLALKKYYYTDLFEITTTGKRYECVTFNF